MTEQPLCKVVNCHWYGGSDTLPPNTHYIGRPSVWGNDYSTKSGKYAKEDCVALHRISLYRNLSSPDFRSRLQRELGEGDLACWCKQPQYNVGCHGDNYLHVLSEPFAQRDYLQSITHYLMDDLRSALTSLEDRICHQVSQEQFLNLYVYYGDTRVVVGDLLVFCQREKIGGDPLHFLLARIVVELELALGETNIPVLEYRFARVRWITDTFIHGNLELAKKPTLPAMKKLKPKKEKTNG